MGKDVKGKKRARSDVQTVSDGEASSSLSPPPPERPKMKKPKRAETRPCPVCEEEIPVRLLDRHAELELQRVEDIMHGAGPSVAIYESDAGPSTGRRGAALRARKSLSALNPRTGLNLDSLEVVEKTIQNIKRNRKQRHTKLREIIAQDERACELTKTPGIGTRCPVCLAFVHGDEDVVNAHVDACVAHASWLQAEAEEREAQENGEQVDVDAWEDYEVNGEVRIRLADATGLRGTGFEVRDRSQRDVEDEVDVDGDDQAVFGDAQFTEQDVLGTALITSQVEGPVDDDTDNEGIGEERRSLRDLVAEGKVITRNPGSSDIEGLKAEMEQVMGLGDADRMDQAISDAKRSGNNGSLVSALENKIKQLESMRVSSSTSLLCRICLDPYNEPTVSTGCWHTCCRECWLRCLGSTSLCPICKRITAAMDLRKIYM